MKSKSFIKQISLFLVLGLFTFLQANKLMNAHAHMSGNGVLTIHYHPFTSSNGEDPLESHSHTNAELLFIEKIDFLDDELPTPYEPFLISQRTAAHHYCHCQTLGTNSTLKKGRAPPEA